MSTTAPSLLQPLAESLATIARTGDAEALLGHLRGRGLPVMGGDSEPAEVVLRALGETEDPSGLAISLAPVLAKVIDRTTEVRAKEMTQVRLLALQNALRLAADLPAEATLASSLRSLAGSLEEAEPDFWFQAPLAPLMARALVYQQTDAQTEPLWRRLLETSGEGPWTPERRTVLLSAWRGLLHVPPEAEAARAGLVVDMDRIESGLLALEAGVRSREGGSRLVRQVLRVLDETFPRSPQFWEERLAGRFGRWPAELIRQWPPRGGSEEWRVVVSRSDIEECIADQLSVSDNFFDLGGGSPLITEVLRRINQWQYPPLTDADLAYLPTVRSLAAHLQPASPDREMRPSVTAHGAERGLRELARDIAIIGLAGRFPDAGNVRELWQGLEAGICSIRQFTEQELLQSGVHPEELADQGYVRAGSVLQGMDLFDSSFFGFTPREAEIMDPQQRFLLECAVEALETAGYPSEKRAGKIGVFVGKAPSLYMLEHLLYHPEIFQRLDSMSVLNTNEKDHAATLVSYKLNLTGPGVNVNNADSTSLVAIHTACQSLLNEECEIALAGGVCFSSTLERGGYLHHEGGILSPDGLCRAFSDDANGSVFGSGVGLVVLKPLAAALRDRDTVHAVIKGSAVNNDGSFKVGYTAPSLHGQAEVIAAAQARAGVSPDSITFLEAHGTGTILGDPIELGALRKVFGGPRPDGSRCVLGSIKTNIGHLGAAAGAAGLIKVVEALKHGTIPPTLHVCVPNRMFDFADSPFYLNTGPVEWAAGAVPRRAGVSSFGVGGTNAHVVVEEAPAVPARPRAGGPQLLPLSAKSPFTLAFMTSELAEELGRRPDLALEDVAFTLQAGRNAYPHRAFLVCDSLAEAANLLAGGRLSTGRHSGDPRAIAFLFPGQCTLRRGVTRELYLRQSAFRGAFDRCAEIVRSYTGGDLGGWLYGEGTDEPDIQETAIAQSLLFAVEYSLARFWGSLGVQPAAMLGHSLGEYVAACLAGVFSLEEVLFLIVALGQLLQSLEPGRMLAVACAEAELRELLRDAGCDLAAVNGPKQYVVSGPAGAVNELQRRLEAAGIFCRGLRTSHAFHSAAVDPILGTFEKCVAAVQRERPAIPFVSNLSGTWITEEEAMSPTYWARHLRETVRFGDGTRELLSFGDPLLLEAGPGHTLSTLVRHSTGAAASRIVPTFDYGSHWPGEWQAILASIGRLWLHGVDIEWERLHEGSESGRVPLPTYAFERRRFWLERRGGIGRPFPEASTATRTEAEAEAEVPAESEEVAASYGRPELGTEYAAPTNEVEVKLVEIWRSILGIEKIGIYDNFIELGGHSLIAAQLASRIRTAFGVELPLHIFFDAGNVAEMAKAIVTQQAQQEDHYEVVSMLAEIEGLSSEEVRALLEAEEYREE